MKSKKKENAPKILSDKNFIRQKARKLPVGKCYTFDDWEESRPCTIVITRVHLNGNLSFCSYLVDLDCLGVKDTAYYYNVTPEFLDQRMSEYALCDLTFVEIPYELAHNIIYAAVDFAKEYGFEPCKDFSSITGFFLEEDTDDFPYIDIKCGGIYGDPIYVNTGFETQARAKMILAQLEKTAGKDNYNCDEDLYGEGGVLADLFDEDEFEDEFDEDDDDEFDDDDDDEFDDDDEYDPIYDEIDALDTEGRKRMFVSLLLSKEDEEDENEAEENEEDGNEEDEDKDEAKDPVENIQEFLNDDNIKLLKTLSDRLAYEMVNEDELEAQFEQLEEKFGISFTPHTILPNSYYSGISNLDMEKDNAWIAGFHPFHNGKKLTKKEIRQFRKIVGDVPLSDFMDLNYLMVRKKDYSEILAKCYEKYPDYFLFKVIHFYEMHKKDHEFDLNNYEDILVNHPQKVTELEAELFFFFYTSLIINNNKTDLIGLLAYEEYVSDLFFLNDDLYDMMINYIDTSKIVYVFNCIRLEHENK